MQFCPTLGGIGLLEAEGRMQVETAKVLIADHLGVTVEQVRHDARFDKDLGADSLDMIELAMRFEEELNIIIADDESESCRTVGDALELIQGKMAA